jgi:hypothetical protein
MVPDLPQVIKHHGDSLCSPSSTPSPERIDESVVEKSPLEQRKPLRAKLDMLLEKHIPDLS